ncbi:MAG: tetratricopeptide repeat protein [Blastocatellia bacterium]
MKKSKIIIAAMLLMGLFTGLRAQDDIPSWDRAVSLYKQAQYAEAIGEFKKVLEEVPNHADSWKYIGLAHFQLKEYEQAIAPLNKSLELKKAEGKSNTEILLTLSRCHLALNHYQQALPVLETLTKQQPDVAVSFYLLGFTYANLKRTNEAVQALRTSLKLDPKDADTWNYLGALQYRAGNLDGAIEAFRGGVAAMPNNIEMLTLLAETLVRRGLAETDLPKANALYDEAIKTAVKLKSLRDDAASTELLGRIYLAAKKYTSAELTLSRALTMTKEPSATLYFNLGLAHAQNKAWQRAAEMLIQANRLNPADINTLNYLGFVYENQRKYPQALDAYNRAYEASGRSNTEIKEAIDRVAPMIRPQ